MNTPRSLLRCALIAVAGVIVLTPHDSLPQCINPAARNLTLGSWIDTTLNPGQEEDVNFFETQAVMPNIAILQDTSGSMVRLPPDGPETLGNGVGAYGTTAEATFSYPANIVTGCYVTTSNPTTGKCYNSAHPTGISETLTTTTQRLVGCGLDPVSAADPNFMTHPMIQSIMARAFWPPCGNAVNPALVGAPYAGDATDYASQMTVCPYFTSTNNQATGAPGFDPDYYTAATTTTTSFSTSQNQNGTVTVANYFPHALVFHDTSLAFNYTYPSSASQFYSFSNFLGDGWGGPIDGPWNSLYPAQSAAGTTATSIAAFCNAYPGNSTLQGSLTRASICNTCLTTYGWWYDGLFYTEDDNGTYWTMPSLWYTGNYLNFFPPKFIIARKVVKDLISTLSNARLALFQFNPTYFLDENQNAVNLVQAFSPPCSASDGTPFDSYRSSYVTSVNNYTWGGGTPTSFAIMNVAQYYASPSLTWFESNSSPGLSSYLSAAMASSSSDNSASVCYACQSNTVVLLTDGSPDPDEGSSPALPAGGLTEAQINGAFYAGAASTGILDMSTTICPQCGTFTGAEAYRNNGISAAFYFNNMDLRKNSDTTLDCQGMPGKQNMSTYTIGFGAAADPLMSQLLTNMATAGGGIFVNASSAQDLRTGLLNIVNQIDTNATSFSVAAVSQLQTVEGNSVIMPSFTPSLKAVWPGHLYRFNLYSEFDNTCVTSAEGNGVGDYACDGQCTSVFLIDSTGAFISEDTTGVFRQNDPPSLPTCTQAPLCQAKGLPCGVTGTALAVPWWDAATTLNSQTWQSRIIYSVVDSNGDGQINQSDTPFQLETTDNVAANAIVPYLGLGASSVCSTIANRMIGAGATAWATLVLGSQVECAKAVIRYLMGADLFNETGAKTGYPTATMDTLWDRPFLLADIFHSSPVEVEPPYPATGVLCASGLATQCVPSLWETPTPMDTSGSGNSYQDYAASAPYQYRRKIVLVGTNDGVLHAFNSGTWLAGQQDPSTPTINTTVAPYNGYYEAGNLSGGAWELWAFLPPALLSKLPLLLGNQHNLFVDGSPMVSDVWVDGTSNGLANAVPPDDIKQKQEFHTVAVVPLRRGGNSVFALDITNATVPGTPPTFLWMYPQPNDPRTLTFGESYDDYLPEPPPIGPVRIAANANGGMPLAGTQTWQQALAGPTPYHERWVVFLSGGFDPQYLRGRGVYMVDVWTGETYFDFSYPQNPSSLAANDPRLSLNFPVPATVAMFPWGQNVVRAMNETNDYFYDTATFGDAGGQIWTLRFSEPGQLSASGLAQNWYGGRLFQMGGAGSCAFCGGQPFFYMTANSALPDTSLPRVFAGTGDRFNLLDTMGGQCGPQNLRACAMRGCTLTLSSSGNLSGTVDLGVLSWNASENACGTLSETESSSTTAVCQAEAGAYVTISGCPSPNPSTGPTSTYKDVQVSCAMQADGYYLCSPSVDVPGGQLVLSDTSNPPTVGNWIFGLDIFDQTGNRQIFSTFNSAVAYDAARLWLKQSAETSSTNSGNIVVMDSSVNNPSTVATDSSEGWAIFYNHNSSVNVNDTSFSVNWMDERSTTAANMQGRIMTWSTVQTTLGTAVSTGSCRTSLCTILNQNLTYHYNADVVTGAPTLTSPLTGLVTRSSVGLGMVPPEGDQVTAFLNQSGQLEVGLTNVSGGGSTNVGVSSPMPSNYSVGIESVPVTAHACRHSWPGSTTTAAVPPSQEACGQ